jgi:hypothetical protein
VAPVGGPVVTWAEACAGVGARAGTRSIRRTASRTWTLNRDGKRGWRVPALPVGGPVVTWAEACVGARAGT